MSVAFAVMMTAAAATGFTFHFVVRLVVAVFFVVFLLAALPVVALAMRSSASATHEPHPLLFVTSTKYVGEGGSAWYTCLFLNQNQQMTHVNRGTIFIQIKEKTLAINQKMSA
ncbi:hypothetical protein AAFJ72_13620 [Brevibacillus gelatini]|uniref:hypothetical protein n=1 Tax=Brevibacillus gelatini TaxID=1655277 RepID=UPI003D812DB1